MKYVKSTSLPFGKGAFVEYKSKFDEGNLNTKLYTNAIIYLNMVEE